MDQTTLDAIRARCEAATPGRCKVNVLGSEWEIIECDPTADHPDLKDREGCCDFYARQIVVYSPLTPEARDKQLRRHELIHAFLFEAGLGYDAEWPMNETMVDFFARQFPKLLKVFEESGAI